MRKSSNRGDQNSTGPTVRNACLRILQACWLLVIHRELLEKHYSRCKALERGRFCSTDRQELLAASDLFPEEGNSMGDLTLSTSIRLLIVDDHAVVRAGFSSVLRRQAGLSVVGSVQSGEEALTFLVRCPADVLLLDLHMPGMGGIETLLALQRRAGPPKVIVLSSFEPDEEICRAVEAGAHGYLRKDISCAEIVEAVHAVHSGVGYCPQWIKDRISERKLQPSLSPRELEILEMVSKGLTNKEIGRAIQVSHFTVRNHVRHIIAKLEVGDRTEATTVAIQQGILMA
jgi:two-component system, NarL family, response regulator